MHLSAPQWLRLRSKAVVLFVAVDSLLIVTPIVGSVIVIRFVVFYFMFILVLQSSW